MLFVQPKSSASRRYENLCSVRLVLSVVPARDCELRVCCSLFSRSQSASVGIRRHMDVIVPSSSMMWRIVLTRSQEDLLTQASQGSTDKHDTSVSYQHLPSEPMHSKHPFLRSYPGDTVNITGMRDTCVRSFVCGLNTQEWFSIFRLIVLSHGVFYVYNDMNDVSVVFRTSRLVYPGM